MSAGSAPAGGLTVPNPVNARESNGLGAASGSTGSWIASESTVAFDVFGLEAQAVETIDRIVSNLRVELAREVQLVEWQVD